MLATQVAAGATNPMAQFQLMDLHRTPSRNSVDLESLKKKVKHIKTKKVHHKKKHGKKSHKKSVKKTKKSLKIKSHGGKHVKQDVVIQRPLWEDFFGHGHEHGHFGMPVHHEELSHGFHGHDDAHAWGDHYGHGLDHGLYGEAAYGAPWGHAGFAHGDDFHGLGAAHDWGYGDYASPYHLAGDFDGEWAGHGLYGDAGYYGLHDDNTIGDYLEDVHDDVEDDDYFGGDYADYDYGYGDGAGLYGDLYHGDYYGDASDYGYDGVW